MMCFMIITICSRMQHAPYRIVHSTFTLVKKAFSAQ